MGHLTDRNFTGDGKLLAGIQDQIYPYISPHDDVVLVHHVINLVDQYLVGVIQFFDDEEYDYALDALNVLREATTRADRIEDFS